VQVGETLTDLQILGCELHKNAFYEWKGGEGEGKGWQYGGEEGEGREECEGVGGIGRGRGMGRGSGGKREGRSGRVREDMERGSRETNAENSVVGLSVSIT